MDADPQLVRIDDESIKLGQFLKLANLVDSGSDAKQLLAGGVVLALAALMPAKKS